MTDEAKRPAPPYVGFKTFTNFLDWLREGIPQQIDRSFWGSRLSGAYGSQTVAALRFFGLLDKDNRPQPPLEALVVADAEGRAKLLADLLRKHYPEVFALGLSNATAKQLRDEFGKYPVDNSTVGKAIAFFLGAAKYAKVPLSSFITKRAAPVSGGARKAAKRRSTPDRDPEREPQREPDSSLSNRPLLAVVMAQLPKDNKWTADEHDRWLKLFQQALDWDVKVSGVK